MIWGSLPDRRGAVTTTSELQAREVRFIASRWRRLSAEDVATLDNTSDLVALLVARYGLDAAQAQKSVDAAMRWAKL
jgi:hypothetical protein